MGVGCVLMPFLPPFCLVGLGRRYHFPQVERRRPRHWLRGMRPWGHGAKVKLHPCVPELWLMGAQWFMSWK